MRYDKSLIENVRSFRKQGYSLGSIASKIRIPKTTIHSWVSDITLSEEQKKTLKDHIQKALQEGREKAQNLNKNRRFEKEMRLFHRGIKEISQLTTKELFVIGIALYWAEGFKNTHERRLGFCNSDPSMIQLYLYWLQKVVGIKKSNIIARLTINSSYKNKEKEIQIYWSKTTGIPLSQFTKTFYQNTKWKKQVTNSESKYNGVLRVHVKDSLDYLLKMRGWIEGIKMNILENKE